MMTYGIPSFKLEKTIIDAEIQVLRELGVEIRCGVEVGRDVTIPQLREQGFLAFYIAIGCQGGRLPGVPGEHAAGTDIAVHFLHEALADENQHMDGRVVVIGAVMSQLTAPALRCASVRRLSRWSVWNRAIPCPLLKTRLPRRRKSTLKFTPAGARRSCCRMKAAM